MNRIAQAGGRLTLLCAASAIMLGALHYFLGPVKAERLKNYHRERIVALARGGQPGEEKSVKDSPGVRAYSSVKDKNGKITAYVLTLTGKGYGGEMTLLAGYKPDGEILTMQLLRHDETPGLGGEAVKASYAEKFAGKGTNKPVPVNKSRLSPAEVNAVSGATLTFSGIGRALEEGSEYVKRLGGSK